MASNASAASGPGSSRISPSLQRLRFPAFAHIVEVQLIKHDASDTSTLAVEGLPDLSCQRRKRKRFGEQIGAGIESSMMDDRVPRIPGREDHR
jgi:hypothetical protein